VGARVPGERGYRLGSECGSPNHGNTLLSKRVMAQMFPVATAPTSLASYNANDKEK
jgi:hypothetical protein